MEWILGAQCYCVRKDMEKDLSSTIRKMKKIGFDTVEPSVFLQEEQKRKPKSQWSLKVLEQMKRETEELGLAIPSVHVNIGLFGKTQSPDTIIKGLLDIHKRTGIMNFVFSGMFSSAPAAERWGRLLAEVSAGVGSEGCKVLYHNHSNEFKLVETDGKRMSALDYFYRSAGPQVGLQLDIGWAGFAGDELEIASKYADRIAEIHCKDFYPEALEESWEVWERAYA